MSVFSINIMGSLIKILNMRRPRVEPWGILVKISIYWLIIIITIIIIIIMIIIIIIQQ